MAKAMKAAMKKSSMKKAGMKKSSMKSSMKKRGMKKSVSIIARGKYAKAKVFSGSKEKTVGGLKKSDLIKNKQGKVVSKKSSLAARKRSGNKLAKWAAAFMKARAALKVKGFAPCGGKTAQGKALLAKTRSFYKK